MRGRPDRDVVDHVEDLAGQRVEVLDPLDLVAEEGDPVGGLGVGGHDLQHLAADPEGAAPQHLVVALVLHLHQLAEDVVAVDLLADLEQLHFFVVDLRRADPVDAGDRGDDDHVAAGEQRRGGGVAEAVDLVVDRGVLLDVEVLRRDVGLGLVVVVVGDEVLDRVIGEELAELVAELRGERLVVGDHQRGPLHLGDRRRHREGLAGAGGAEQGLEAFALAQALGQPGDRLRLVRRRRVGGVQLEIRHGDEHSWRHMLGLVDEALASAAAGRLLHLHRDDALRRSRAASKRSCRPRSSAQTQRRWSISGVAEIAGGARSSSTPPRAGSGAGGCWRC